MTAAPGSGSVADASPAAAIPAATLILFRPAPRGGPPELLMVERSRAMAFAPGALVFPGGRVEPGDAALAGDAPDDTRGEGAARMAAIRETLEEAGLPAGLVPPPPPRALDAIRAGLASGRDFAGLLADAGCAPAPDALVPFARWRPAHRLTRVFDARFYLAEAPAGYEAGVDGTENARLLWTTAADALAGGATLIFPTRRNLERLAMFDGYAAAVAHARTYPVRTIVPWVEERDGIPWLCIPDDLGYPVTAEPLEKGLRG